MPADGTDATDSSVSVPIGEWEDLVIDAGFIYWHNDNGKWYLTKRHSNGEWRGYGFALRDEFKRFFSFTANEDEVDVEQFFDGMRPMVLRKHQGIEQIKILVNEPNYELQEGETWPLMFQNYRFWHSNEDEELWDSCYEEHRKGDDVHLTTYGGGPSGGYIIKLRGGANDTVQRWHQTFGMPVQITNLPMGTKLMWRYNPVDMTNSVGEFRFMFEFEAMYQDEMDQHNAMTALEHYQEVIQDMTDDDAVSAETINADTAENDEQPVAEGAQTDSSASPPAMPLQKMSRVEAQKRIDRRSARKAKLLAKAAKIDDNNPYLNTIAAGTPSHSEEKIKNDECTICLATFQPGQTVHKYRCGHALCAECMPSVRDRGWIRCMACLRSESVKEVMIEEAKDAQDLSVVLPASCSGAAASSSNEPPSEKCDQCGSQMNVIGGGSDDDFINICKKCKENEDEPPFATYSNFEGEFADELPRGDVVRLITYLAENNANGSNDSAIAELEDKRSGRIARGCARPGAPSPTRARARTRSLSPPRLARRTAARTTTRQARSQPRASARIR